VKQLGLLRHAKSSWDDPRLDDFDRPLNGRGRKAARRMGDEVRSLGIAYDFALVSPAKRAAETFELVQRAWKTEIESAFERDLYLASPKAILAIIARAPSSAQRLLVVGHNPGMHALATMLTGDDPALSEKFPTGALAEIALPADRWEQAGEPGGRLLRFLKPRDL
jgi:phosphohistidine phosphatase